MAIMLVSCLSNLLLLSLFAQANASDLNHESLFLQQAFDGALLAQHTPNIPNNERCVGKMTQLPNGQWKILDGDCSDESPPMPPVPSYREDFNGTPLGGGYNPPPPMTPEPQKVYKLIVPKQEPRTFQILPNKTVKSRQPKKPIREFLPLYGQCHKPYWAKSTINEETLLKYREGSPELVQMLEKIADELCEVSPETPLHFGDLNAKEGHRGHKKGTSVDVLVSFDGFEEGPIGKIEGLNWGHGKTFHAGSVYNRDRTIEIIKKFLLFRDYVYKKKNEKGRMRLCELYEEGCETYEVRVKTIITSDPYIHKHFKDLGFRQPENQAEGIVTLRTAHANHFHVVIEVVPAVKPLSPQDILWLNTYTVPQPKREFHIDYPSRSPFKPR